MNTCIYLRKSRADEEMERLHPGSTLTRHKEMLFKAAQEKNLNIINIHEEVISGEHIADRPEMCKLLNEVSNGNYDAVLVMDMDRLGRGNMQEQGLILDTFKESHTKIITPRKIYDLQNEFDEEYSEFEAFMARKEFKIINRRMQRGRIKSVEEGKYIYACAPFGYRIVGEGKTRRLEIEPDNAEIVKIVFHLYTEGLGGSKIALQLNKMGYKTATGSNFSNSTILNMIKNPVYIGKLTWGRRTEVYHPGHSPKKGTALKSRENWSIFQGVHEPIISEELYFSALEQLQRRTHAPSNIRLANPFAGLIFCHECGYSMKFRTYTNSVPHIYCNNIMCHKTRSSRFDIVENRIIQVLQQVLKNYTQELPSIKQNDTTAIENNIHKLEEKIKKMHKQKNSLCDLLEQRIYTAEEYLKRNELITKNLETLEEQLSANLKEKQKKSTTASAMPNLNSILEIYSISSNNELKNQMMKNAIQKIIYTKPKENKNDDFQLKIFLKI